MSMYLIVAVFFFVGFVLHTKLDFDKHNPVESSSRSFGLKQVDIAAISLLSIFWPLTFVCMVGYLIEEMRE